MTIGVIALQGNYQKHKEKLDEAGFKTQLIKESSQLKKLSGIVTPGGESTTLLKLINNDFKKNLTTAITNGTPTIATCAGLILIAKNVTAPRQQSFNLIDLDVQRNGFGRQVNSFITKELIIEDKYRIHSNLTLEGVFIRAPRITRIGSSVETVLSFNNEPVLVKSKNILAATFHPEMSSGKHLVYDIFSQMLN